MRFRVCDTNKIACRTAIQMIGLVLFAFVH